MNSGIESVHYLGGTSFETKALSAKGNDYRKISSITELINGDHGNYAVQFENAHVIDIVKQNDTLFVSKDGVIFTTDTKSECFNKARSLVKNKIGKFDFRIVSQEVLTFIRNQQVSVSEISQGEKGVEVSSDAQKMWKSIIKSGIERKASDIHIKIKSNGYCAVYFRIDGSLRLAQGFQNFSSALVIKMMNAAVNFDAHKEGGVSTKQFTLSIPNDSQVPVNFENGESIQIRVGVMPGPAPETGKVSLRLLTVGSSGKIRNFEELGFLPEQSALMREAMYSPYGAILFTGPTGSGKSTGIVAALSEVENSNHIITLENPIETLIDNDACIQCAVNEDVPELTFAKLLASALRNDPDVIMVGEVRSPVVAETYARASTTGHLVLTTLHVNNALEVPAALEHYGLELHTITERSFLRLIVAQRLVKTLCNKCKVPISKSREVLDKRIKPHTFNRVFNHFKDDQATIFVKSRSGCKDCDYCGFKGRSLIAEVIKPDDLARDSISNRDNLGWRKGLYENGWIDMKAHAELLVRSGVICPFTVEGEVITPFGTDTLNDIFNYRKFREEISSEALKE